MSMFGLLLAGGSFAFGVVVWVAAVGSDNPNGLLVLPSLGASVVGIIAGLTLAIAGVFI